MPVSPQVRPEPVRRHRDTAAIKVMADDETGELESATVLGQFGEIPDDFAESLAAG